MIETPTVDTKLLNALEKVSRFIGNTPLFPIENVYRKKNVRIFAKLEWQQLGNSVKSRPAFNIIKNAVREGRLNSETELLDASSGNTGIAFAAIGAALGIKVNICMPENASEERKTTLRAFGANLILTSKFGSTDESQDIACELYHKNPGKYFYADQYSNNNNWKAHYYGTSEEILFQTNRQITHFVVGIGTSGTFTGNGRKFREVDPSIQLISLQPNSAMHGLEGWKHLATAKVPKIYDPTLGDDRLLIDPSEAHQLIKETAHAEGLFISPSAAANLSGAIQLAEKIDHGTIVTVFADNSDKYGEVNRSLFSV